MPGETCCCAVFLPLLVETVIPAPKIQIRHSFFFFKRDCDREVTAHLKLCKISNSENIDNERKLLLARAGEYFADQNILTS